MNWPVYDPHSARAALLLDGRPSPSPMAHLRDAKCALWDAQFDAALEAAGSPGFQPAVGRR